MATIGYSHTGHGSVGIGVLLGRRLFSDCRPRSRVDGRWPTLPRAPRRWERTRGYRRSGVYDGGSLAGNESIDSWVTRSGSVGCVPATGCALAAGWPWLMAVPPGPVSSAAGPPAGCPRTGMRRGWAAGALG